MLKSQKSMEKEVSNGRPFNKLLSNIYFNPRLRGSLSGKNALFKAAKLINNHIKLKDVETFLDGQSTYVDHRMIRRKFPRRKYVMSFPDEIWGIDLCFIQSYKKYNKNFQYILVAVDFFSR